MSNEPIPSALADTNILLRHLLGDIPDHAERANSLFDKVMLGELRIYAPSTVFLEASYVLTRSKGVPVEDAATGLGSLLSHPGLVTDHYEALIEALSLWKGQGPLSFADCFHLALTKQLGMDSIYTFDQKMGRYAGVTRIEP